MSIDQAMLAMQALSCLCSVICTVIAVKSCYSNNRA